MQLIFRKVSDVLKEQELAEKRKNDPVLNHTQDHLVRKLFSKFKKGGEATPGAVKDVETGGGGGPGASGGGGAAAGGGVALSSLSAKALTVAKEDGEAAGDSAPAIVAAPKPKLKGWGRFKAAAAGDGGGAEATPTPSAPPKAEVALEVTPAPPSPVSSSKAASDAEAVSKAEVMFTKAPEAGEVATAASTKASSVSTTTTASKHEMKALNDRLNRIENLLSDFLSKLPPPTEAGHAPAPAPTPTPSVAGAGGAAAASNSSHSHHHQKGQRKNHKSRTKHLPQFDDTNEEQFI